VALDAVIVKLEIFGNLRGFDFFEPPARYRSLKYAKETQRNVLFGPPGPKKTVFLRVLGGPWRFSIFSPLSSVIPSVARNLQSGRLREVVTGSQEIPRRWRSSG